MRRLRKDSNRLAPLPKPVIMEAHQNKVCIGHLNVQSLGSKTTGKYLDILSETNLQLVDVLCITETHLKKDEQVSCNNFLKCKEGSVFRCDRSGMKGEGVAMIISNKYEHHSIKIPGNRLEVVAEIMCPMRTAIVSICIPPSQKKSSSMDGLTTVLSHLNTSENEHIIIIRDFNEYLTCSGNH